MEAGNDDPVNEVQFEDAEEEGTAMQLLSSEHQRDDTDCKSAAAAAAATATSSKKRPREEGDLQDKISSDNMSNIPAIAKARLSKWAARLFDPDRPRGLIEPPQVIPLNDEFLQAFGKREKESDQVRGVTLEIEHEINDDDDDTDTIPEDADEQPAVTPKNSSLTTQQRKVKITNIKYTVTASELEATCSQFGAVELTNLLMNEQNESLNNGLAFVTFQSSESAQVCVQQLTQVGSRPVTVSIAASLASSSKKRSSASASRYWQADEPDLSTKCFRCGGVGHMAAECKNAAKVKPCPLCASTDHDFRACPSKQICFNCGIPGHVSRDCQMPRNMPARRICTVCYQQGHHKTQCRQNGALNRPPSVQAAVCLTCGKTGHYLCRQLKWFFGLEGVSCSNW